MESQPDSIAGRLEAVASARPDAPFLHRPGDAPVTYGVLGEHIRRVRERLREWRVVPGDVVAGFDPSRALMAMACATLPSSCTFAPLSGSLAPDAYAALLRRLRAKAVLAPADPGHPLRVAAARVGVPAMRIVADGAAAPGGFALELDADRTDRIEALAHPGHAYVLVTSGTTGKPKLAPLGHRQMLAFAGAMIAWLSLVPDDVGYALAPFHFAGGLRASILIPAISGASFVCLEESDIDGVFHAIEAYRPTNLGAPFSIHRAILRRAADFPGEVAASRFRFLRTTAGRLDADEAARLERLFRAPVLQALGSTEACGIAHDPMPPRPRKRGSVGVPLGGDVRAMDALGRLCAAGETGELVVRGPLVFDGYLDDPELTARSFAGDWLRTGDEGRVDEDGYVFVTGRLAESINRGGEKVSPAEVDRALESLPGVREAAAFGIPHPVLGEDLVVAAVLDAGASIGEAEILAHARERLAPGQVPRRVVIVESLPRTDAGKLRRRELAAHVGIDAEARDGADGDSRVPAASALEAALAGLWSAVLRRGDVGRDDDFFLQGGDSMAAAHLLREVEAVFGVALPLRALLEDAATPAAMARAIERARALAAG
ncbi:oxalate---CoA ligase [Burkholderiales bacterium]|nr:oxalate---CoA ligase [Burkholderiales bacterium]